MKIEILHETDQWLASSKPAHISVHNDPGNDLISFLKKQCDQELFPVNRLDLGTSGIVLIAKTKEAAQALGAIVSARECKKYYSAICYGHIKGSSSEWNCWDLSLSKKAEGRKNPRGMSKDRVPCETRWKLVEQRGRCSVIDIHLITGRKHQIRRHAVLAKATILGDGRYGNPKGKRDRLALHARQLEFQDPFTKEEVCIHCPVEDSFWELIP